MNPRDLIALVKPRISTLVIFTTACGLWLAPQTPSPFLAFMTLFGTVLMVGGANALNMYLERDSDALMLRTKNRPLAAKRLAPKIALRFGIALALLSTILLYKEVNPLTALLGVIAFISYVLFYTPLKQKSHAALLVGAVPGAIPPLMGWTAATGKIALPGLILFFILLLWQVPHFLAIALVRKEEYEKAGIKILPLEKGERVTKHWIVRYLLGLFAVTLYPSFYGITKSHYLWFALVLNGAFLFWGCYGLRSGASTRWARSFFFASIVYLPLLLFALLWLSKT